jgi:hypothetical protein
MQKTFLTIAQLAADPDCPFSEGGLRWQIFNAHPRISSRGDTPGNGLAPAIVRVGRKVLIDKAAFLGWLDNHRQQAANPREVAA